MRVCPHDHVQPHLSDSLQPVHSVLHSKQNRARGAYNPGVAPQAVYLKFRHVLSVFMLSGGFHHRSISDAR